MMTWDRTLLYLPRMRRCRHQFLPLGVRQPPSMSLYLIECVILAKGTGNRSSDLMNLSGCTSLHSDLMCLWIHNKSINLSAKRSGSHQTNMFAKQAPAKKGFGLLGFSPCLPSAELAPVQATKKPMLNPSKGISLQILFSGDFMSFC